jgi:hypothetical protein
MTKPVMQYPPRPNQLRASLARPSISLAGKQFAFRPVSGANPEESGGRRTVSAFQAHFFMKNAG